MKMSFKPLLFTVFPSVFCFILSLFSKGPLFLSFLNNLFLFSIVLLMLGSSLFVTHSGFFAGMVKSNNQLFKKTVKMEVFISQYDEALPQFINPVHLIIRRLLLAGGILFFITLFTSFIFYNQ